MIGGDLPGGSLSEYLKDPMNTAVAYCFFIIIYLSKTGIVLCIIWIMVTLRPDILGA